MKIEGRREIVEMIIFIMIVENIFIFTMWAIHIDLIVTIGQGHILGVVIGLCGAWCFHYVLKSCGVGQSKE